MMGTLVIRKLCAAVAALLVSAGLVATLGAPSEARTFSPQTGPYVAVDANHASHGSDMVTFDVTQTSAGLQVANFKVGTRIIDATAIVSSANHHFSGCHGDTCIRGTWAAADRLYGEFKLRDSPHWTSYRGHPRPTPKPGTYVGSDGIEFRLVREDNGALWVRDFKIDGRLLGSGSAYVHLGSFSHGFSGFWLTATHVYGRYHRYGAVHGFNAAFRSS